VTNN
jgi:hypothetical protein